MKNKYLLQLLPFLFIIFLASCSNKPKENLSVYRALTSSLNKSNLFITKQDIQLQHSLEEKLENPQTKEKALIWHPTAMLAKSLTNQIIEYIDSLQEQLKLEAGSEMVNGIQLFKESNRDAVYNLFIKKGEGEKLRYLLVKFQNSLLQLNPEIMLRFKNTINIYVRLSDPSEEKQKSFAETFFGNIPTVAALAILSNFQNNAKIIENQVVEFCDNKIPSIDRSVFKI